VEGSLAQFIPVFSVWDGGSRWTYLGVYSHSLEQASKWPSAKYVEVRSGTAGTKLLGNTYYYADQFKG
jgi:hypothetical protein